jgi:hypothetical protein
MRENEAMSLKPRQASQALINPQGQTPEKVHAIMNQILGFAGCHTCGRLIRLVVEFGDPAPDGEKTGAVAFTEA